MYLKFMKTNCLFYNFSSQKLNSMEFPSNVWNLEMIAKLHFDEIQVNKIQDNIVIFPKKYRSYKSVHSVAGKVINCSVRIQRHGFLDVSVILNCSQVLSKTCIGAKNLRKTKFQISFSITNIHRYSTILYIFTSSHVRPFRCFRTV